MATIGIFLVVIGFQLSVIGNSDLFSVRIAGDAVRISEGTEDTEDAELRDYFLTAPIS